MIVSEAWRQVRPSLWLLYGAFHPVQLSDDTVMFRVSFIDASDLYRCLVVPEVEPEGTPLLGFVDFPIVNLGSRRRPRWALDCTVTESIDCLRRLPGFQWARDSVAVEPEPQRHPEVPRNESFDDWLKRTSSLIEEMRRHGQ